MADGKINVDVRLLLNRERLNVQDSITVEELWRMLIWSNSGHPPTQDLVFNGKVLPYKHTLRECKVVDGSILYAIFQIKKRNRDDQIPIQVNIVVTTGKIIALLLQRDALIEEVKDLVFSHEGIPSCSQWLFCQGCLIPDDSWIGEISNPGDDVIHLMMCPSRNDFTPELRRRISSNDPILTSLEILGQPLGAAGCQALADALLLNTCITSLNLYCSSVGPAGASALLPALLHLTGMTYLNLSGTDLQPSGIAQLCAALQYLKGLNELDVSFNTLTADDGARVCGAIASTGMTQLKVLNLMGNSFTATSVVESDAWKQMYLPHLPVSFTEVCTFTALVHCLVHSYTSDCSNACSNYRYRAAMHPELQWRISSNDPILTSLEILGQPLGAAGCQALADALLLNTRITSLNLYCSSVGPAGASALLPALLHLTGMTYLNLSGTDLQPSGIAQLCAALQYMTALTELDLENGLDESGVCSVVRSLLLMPKLSIVRLDHTISSCIGELQTTGVIRYPVLPEVERRGCGAVLRHLQQSVRLRFCCCITRHCLHQLSVALQCRIFFPQPTFDTMYGAAQRLPRARLLRLFCYSGIFRLFAAKIVPRNENHRYVRLLLLRTVCSAATASLLCNSGKDR